MSEITEKEKEKMTTSKIGNLTRLIHTFLYVVTIHPYIRTPHPGLVGVCVGFLPIHSGQPVLSLDGCDVEFCVLTI